MDFQELQNVAVFLTCKEFRQFLPCKTPKRFKKHRGKSIPAMDIPDSRFHVTAKKS